jgi:nucleoside-diphosphate-sugar epimerase
VTQVAVTGATGSVGRRVVELLVAEPGVGLIRALDRIPLECGTDVDFRLVDVATLGDDGQTTEATFHGCDTVIHLADDPRHRNDPAVALTMLERVLDEADRSGCPHVVLLSSALVYGAYPGNPIPLTERHRRRPNPELAYAVIKARLERQVEAWAARTRGEYAILRPTTTLSERGASYIGGALRAATVLRGDGVEAPVQFLHHDDLATAVCLAALKRLTGIYNVAPDGWIGPEVFRDLQGDATLRPPEPVSEHYGRLVRTVHRWRVEVGIAPYVEHAWVVANDRLRNAGWEPSFSNEETYVASTPTPWWRRASTRHRQELALGVMGMATAAAIAGAGAVARRLIADR